jgi:hypothetical protein
VVTDRATYAYLGDVYVEAAHRGRGLGKYRPTLHLANSRFEIPACCPLSAGLQTPAGRPLIDPH